MCQYFSKSEDQCSQTKKQAAKGGFKNNIHHNDTMATIAKAYVSNRGYTVPYSARSVYHILPELKLRTIFLAVYSVNVNPPEEKVQVFLKKNLANYQNIVQICLRNEILIVIWKNKVQHSAMEETVF